MQERMDSMYQAAHQEVFRTQAMLQETAVLFNGTFALSEDEVEQLNAHVDLHASGGAVELAIPEADVIFSLRTVSDPQADSSVWELVAYRGDGAVPDWICAMRVGPTASGAARRIRGARLVAAIGDYLEREQTEARGELIDFKQVDTNITVLPRIAAESILQTA